MSANAGPDIVEDGIVFYYDTGNTVKSYIGEPTTNLALDAFQQGGWPGTHTLVSSGTKTFDLTTSTVEWGGNASWTMFYYDVTAYTGQHICLSATYEYSTSPGGGNLAYIFIGQTTGSQTYLGYSSPLDYNVYYPTSSQQISWNGVIGDGGKIGILTWMNNGTSTTLTSRFSKVQLEVKTHPTQFVNGTRSVTQGLLNLPDNGVINVTNASFNSNAQLVFDGTNDSIFTANSSYLNPGSSTFSIETIFNCSNASVGEGIIYNKESIYETAIHGGYFQYAWEPHWNWDGDTTFPVSSNTWYHAVVTYDGSYQRMYKNGVEVYNRAQSGNIGTNSNVLSMGARGVDSGGNSGYNFFPGQIPIVRIYKAALSASEVLINYNAFKTRFGI
jgi:hypothetical protein